MNARGNCGVCDSRPSVAIGTLRLHRHKNRNTGDWCKGSGSKPGMVYLSIHAGFKGDVDELRRLANVLEKYTSL